VARLTRWVLAHRKLVVAFWVLVTLVGIVTSGAATRAMDQKFSVPGRESWETNVAIAESFRGTGGNGLPLIPVVTLPAGRTVRDPAVRADMREVEETLARTLPGSRIAGYGSTGDAAFTSEDGRTAFAVAYPPPDPDQPFGDNPRAARRARAALEGMQVGNAAVHLTGWDALYTETSDNEGPGLLLEALVGGLGALLVLAFVFGSLIAFVPLLMAIPAIFTSFLAVLGLTQFTGVSPIVQFLVALIGLGVAIDFSLLIVMRWREERAHGLEGDEAVVRAMETAGRAVVFSGTTVAIGLLALVALPLPFLRSIGYGGMLIPLMSVGVALTLLPVVLHSASGRLDWPHIRTDDKASRFWTGWARGVVRYRVFAILTALLVLGALLVAAFNMRLGVADTMTIAQSGDAQEGLVALKDSGIGTGAVTPHEVLVRGGIDGIHGAVAPADGWRTNGSAVVIAFPTLDGSAASASDLTAEVRDVAHAQGESVTLGGTLAQNDDFIDAVYGNFPLMLLLVGVVTFLLLARAFRSVLLPAKAVVLNILSVAAAWGVLVLVWQQGWLSDAIWGIPATGAIDSWIPLMVFAFLFGLSMDYEVFILSRMREEYDRTGETREAVITGIGRTGRLVTSAALILFLAFLSLSSSPGTQVKVLATGLAAGILLDATVIRALLVPAVVSLFGNANWWLPDGFARLLRVEPSHARQRAAAGAKPATETE